MSNADQRTDAFIGKRGDRATRIMGHGAQMLRMVREHGHGHGATSSPRRDRIAQFGHAIAAIKT